VLPRIPTVVAVALMLFSAAPAFARQAWVQPQDKPLYPPNFISTGDSVLVGFSLVAVPGLPFSATIEAESRTTDSKRHTTVQHYHTKIARDARGRTREDTDLNPEGEPANPQWLQTSIYDTVAKAQIQLFPAAKVAMRTPDQAPAPKPLRTRPQPVILVEPQEFSGSFGFSAQPQIVVKREELASEVIDGMALRHGRESTTFPAGFAGNKDARTTVTDYWYSQELQTFVLVKMVGPGNSEHVLRLRNLQRQDSPKALFEIPKGYALSKPQRHVSYDYGYCPVP
jgi:hypothetical protein